MTKHSFQNTIDALPVFDTHTHLNGASLPAQIKRLLEDFLYEQIESGRIDAEGAITVARQWLHDSAATLYK
jgi:hypothetical protein